MTAEKPKPKVEIKKREPGKKTEPGIFANLRPLPHPVEEILGLIIPEVKDQKEQITDQLNEVDKPVTSIIEPPEELITQVTSTQVINTPAINTQETQSPRYVTPETEYPGELVTQVISSQDTHFRGESLPRVKSADDPGYHCPNWLDDEILPVLQLSEQAVLRRLFRLSYGFHRQITDAVSVSKLAEKCNLSEKGVKLAIRSLEDKGLIIAHRDFSGNNKGGNRYEVLTQVMSTPGNKYPSTSVSSKATTYIKDHDHDLKIQDHHQKETTIIYKSLTGNQWTQKDDAAYKQIKSIPVEHIRATIQTVMQRAPQKPATLAYFVKEILSPTPANPKSRIAQERELERIIKDVKYENRHRNGYLISELCEDVKEACARQGVIYDNDLFNKLTS